MTEVDEKDESKASWKDVIILLRGELRAGITASQVLADVLEEEELPDVFHQLCTRYLIAKEWTARSNAGVTIKNLCVKFASQLSPLITCSRSDGELLTLSELDISAVSCCKDAELLGGNSTGRQSVEGSEIYTKSWLKKQRKALRKRLGLEALTVDAAIATEYISDEVLVDDSDLTGGGAAVPPVCPIPADMAGSTDTEEPHAITTTTATADDERNVQKVSNIDLSTETWIAR